MSQAFDQVIYIAWDVLYMCVYETHVQWPSIGHGND